MSDKPDQDRRISGVSFRAKITALSLVATMAGLSVAIPVFVVQDWLGGRSDLAERSCLLGQSAASHLGRALAARNPALASGSLEDFESAHFLQSATVYDDQGRVFLRWGRQTGRASELQVVSLSGPTARFHDGKLEVSAPVIKGGEHLGELVLVSSEHEVWADLYRNILFGVLLFLGGSVLAGALAFWLSGRALKPLDRLAAGFEWVRQTKDFTLAVAPSSNDEFGWLTQRFNALLADLESNDAALRRAMEDLTEARDAADAASVMKSQFLANMSHEIRTPLNGVLGMAQVMAAQPMDPAQKERLDVIRQSGEALLAILNDLLDLSKIEAGKLELEEAPFDLAELASGAHAAFTSVANAKGVSFNLVIGEAARGVWRGDSVRVRQILYNLISNALKFTTDGEVRVTLDGVAWRRRKALLIRVEDTGIGIARDKLKSLFDKFVQADSSTTRKFGGTGLGLSICRELVELMKGSITVQSAEGEGATFRVVLPIRWLSPEVKAAQASAAPPAPASSDPEAPALRILAAEDNPTNQTVLRTILRSIGIEPVIVSNGQEAVDAWLQGGFDAVLMDIQMPVLDGVSAARRIRMIEADQKRAPTPIIALSANAMKHQVADYLAAGMDAHLAKPIQLDKLYAMLAALGSRREEVKSTAA